MERDDKDMLEVTRDWRHGLRDWLRSTDSHIPVWQAFAAFVLLVMIAVFSINAFAPGGIGDLIGGSSAPDTGGSTDTQPPAPDDGVVPADGEAEPEEEQAAEEPPQDAAEAEPTAPAHFVGTILSDNGWFTITVTDDGQASGTLYAQETAQGDSSVSSGAFSGVIGADGVIACDGTLSGTTTSSSGQQWPFEGTISVRAVPVDAANAVWQIDFQANPGQAASLPAHAQ